MAALSLSPSKVLALPVRSLRTSLGAWMLVYQALAAIVRDPSEAIDRLERRGLRVERVLERELRRIRKNGRSEIYQLADTALGAAIQPVKWMTREVVATGAHAEDELERQVERVLDRLGIPSRERLEKLSQEIESLSAKIDLELMRLDDGEKAAV